MNYFKSLLAKFIYSQCNFDNLVPFFYTGLLQHFLIVVSAAKADKGRIIKEANLMIVRSQDDFEIPL